MRHYVDLHLRPATPEQTQEMIQLAVNLGYSHVASTMPSVGAATRIDIDAKRGRELQDALRKNRRRYDIIAVRCLSKEVARMVAKDDRVDILLFPEDLAQRKQNWLDHHEGALIKGTGRAYEINVSELLNTGSTRLAKVITTIKRDLVVALKHDIPVVLSSGAISPLMMREPRALTALSTLLDIDEDYAADMLSTIPEVILKRNRARHEEEQ
jgi:RNase P/RNase MRP subunit p30